MMVIQEVLIGLALGFCMQVVMHVFVLAGQFIAMKMGLGFAAMNDPSSGVSVTILSQFYGCWLVGFDMPRCLDFSYR